MTTAKKSSIKGPSRAELDSMAKKGILNEADWTAAMTNMGYDPTWIPLLWQIV